MERIVDLLMWGSGLSHALLLCLRVLAPAFGLMVALALRASALAQ